MVSYSSCLGSGDYRLCRVPIPGLSSFSLMLLLVPASLSLTLKLPQLSAPAEGLSGASLWGSCRVTNKPVLLHPILLHPTVDAFPASWLLGSNSIRHQHLFKFGKLENNNHIFLPPGIRLKACRDVMFASGVSHEDEEQNYAGRFRYQYERPPGSGADRSDSGVETSWQKSKRVGQSF